MACRARGRTTTLQGVECRALAWIQLCQDVGSTPREILVVPDSAGNDPTFTLAEVVIEGLFYAISYVTLFVFRYCLGNA